jgi:hypothetical protein
MKKPYYLTTFKIVVLSSEPVVEPLTQNFYEAISNQYIPEVRAKKEKRLTIKQALAYLDAQGMHPTEDHLPKLTTAPAGTPTPPKPPSRARSTHTPDTASP